MTCPLHRIVSFRQPSLTITLSSLRRSRQSTHHENDKSCYYFHDLIFYLSYMTFKFPRLVTGFSISFLSLARRRSSTFLPTSIKLFTILSDLPDRVNQLKHGFSLFFHRCPEIEALIREISISFGCGAMISTGTFSCFFNSIASGGITRSTPTIVSPLLPRLFHKLHPLNLPVPRLPPAPVSLGNKIVSVLTTVTR